MTTKAQQLQNLQQQITQHQADIIKYSEIYEKNIRSPEYMSTLKTLYEQSQEQKNVGAQQKLSVDKAQSTYAATTTNLAIDAEIPTIVALIGVLYENAKNSQDVANEAHEAMNEAKNALNEAEHNSRDLHANTQLGDADELKPGEYGTALKLDETGKPVEPGIEKLEKEPQKRPEELTSSTGPGSTPTPKP